MKNAKPKDNAFVQELTEILEERQQQYGDPKPDFELIARLWTAYLNFPVSPEDVPRMMILLKTARAKMNHKRDTMLDIAGYAAKHEDLYA